jgi:transglutaminase-like putative cysteine protease
VFDLNDFELEHSDEPPVRPPPPPSTNYALWTMAIVAAIAVAGGVWYFTPKTQPSAPTAVKVPSAAAPQPAAPEREGPLPQTDPIVRELVSQLSSHPTVAAWLTTKGLIANFTVTTLTIAEGRTPVQFLRPLAPRGRFRTKSVGEELLVDPRSYDRYSPHADAIAALDSLGTARLYLTLKPRISDAYRELGYPDGDFDRVLERAIGVLLQTPALDDRVALLPKGVTYAYADPKLESLSPAQRQFLRLGPRNSQAIRAKLEEVAALLKLHPESLHR